MIDIRNVSVLKEEFEKKSVLIKTENDLEMLKSFYLSKTGVFAKLMAQLPNLTLEEKREQGQNINSFKDIVKNFIEEKEKYFLKQQNEIANQQSRLFDVSCQKPKNQPKGNLHFYSKFIEEIEDVFISMGYELFEGTEVVDDYYNFTALNIPHDHPARDMQDTLWLNRKDKLLRTHTSSVQIKAMIQRGAPMAGIATGRVFRQEALDATHESSFNQLEGIFIDEKASLSELFGITKQALQKIFKKSSLDIRIRPGFFPFVVPGVEVDMQCIFCTSGCNICKYTSWIEVAPGGMIHPFVLKSGGIDISKYSGFAFCFGIERLAMLRHQITDIRLFKNGDIRFLNQW